MRMLFGCCFVFFKQKTAYEMRSSAWSSDVCSSDLLRNIIAGRVQPDAGRVLYRTAGGEIVDLANASEAARRHLMRTEWGFVQQHARDGLRMEIGRASFRE